MTVMYEDFYELRVQPFQMVPDPEFLYWSDNHLMAFTMLRYGVMTTAPITVITGGVGTGKTTLLRQLMQELPHDLEVGLISNLQPGRGQLLEWVLMALGQDFNETSYVKLFKQFQDFVINAYSHGRRVTLVVDEAQNLGVELIEELRMLSNINSEKDQLLQIILIGQPQLRDLLQRPELEQFVQRISSDFHLSPLEPAEVGPYIQRRLAVAGAGWEIFSPRTIELIAEMTDGIPRLINTLCDICLVYGYSAERKVIEEDVLREVVAAMNSHGIYTQFRPLPAAPTLVHDADHPEPLSGRPAKSQTD